MQKNIFVRKNLILGISFIFTVLVTSPFVSAAGKSLPGLSADQALAVLKEGNLRFIHGKSMHDGPSEARRLSLVNGQRPHSILLSCSDSRVPPEVLFDQGLGDLFVVRVAGNILDDSTAASIEYAVEHLGARLIVVMGHDSCGAVKAALTSSCDSHAASPDLDHLITTLHRSVGCKSEKNKDIETLIENDPLLRKPAMKNAEFVAQHMVRRSAIIRHYVEHGELKIIPAHYSLKQGEVYFETGHHDSYRSPHESIDD